jgi:hypothetical protein
MKKKTFWGLVSLSVSKYRSDRFSLKLPVTLSLLNSFLLYKLLHEELSVPRPLPWRFEFSSVEILVPSGDVVLSFMVRSLPSSIQIPPWIIYQ